MTDVIITESMCMAGKLAHYLGILPCCFRPLKNYPPFIYPVILSLSTMMDSRSLSFYISVISWAQLSSKVSLRFSFLNYFFVASSMHPRILFIFSLKDYWVMAQRFKWNRCSSVVSYSLVTTKRQVSGFGISFYPITSHI